MAAPTHTYCDYAAGNDYKGATFTDGAYTSATKTLVKTGAFAASKVNHWLYLESNDGGSIVAGYYKIATVTNADTVILATDAGAGVDDDAAKCTQADGSTSKPWRSIQGALDLITRDATNGDQINVKAGTAQVLSAALALTTYGAPGETNPIVFRGYTSAENDGGVGEIDCGGFTMFAATNNYMIFKDLEMHTFGNNSGVTVGTYSVFEHCEVHKGASAPSGKTLINGNQTLTGTRILNCYIHDCGTNGTGVSAFYVALSTFSTHPNACEAPIVSKCLFVDCDACMYYLGDGIIVSDCSVYSSTARTGSGIYLAQSSARNWGIGYNNIVEGYSGVGGDGIVTAGDIALVGYNAFYNNTTNETYGADVWIDLGGDQTPASSPFTNPGAGDFSLNAAVAGAIETAWPGAWYGPASTTNKADMGAVQKGAGVSGPPGWL